MTENNTEFEQLLSWISEAKEIPAETRRDFFAHLQKVGEIDAQAEKFIDQTIEFLAHKNEKKAQALQQKIAILEAVSSRQKNPEKSLAYQIAGNVSHWMMDKVQNFKSWFKAKEATAMQAEESGEKSREISEIDAIKAALN